MLSRRSVLVLVVAGASWLGATGTLAAHGGGAAIEVLEAAESRPGEVRLRVGIVHMADGHPAEGAIVEVAAVAPDGTTSAPRAAERQEEPGTYAARLDLPEPGGWTLVVTSSFPPGTLEVPVTVGATEGQADGDAQVVAAADPDGAAADGADPDEVDLDQADLEEAAEDDGGRTTTNLVIAAVSGVVGGSLGLWASKRRSARRRAAAVDRDDGHQPT